MSSFVWRIISSEKIYIEISFICQTCKIILDWKIYLNHIRERGRRDTPNGALFATFQESNKNMEKVWGFQIFQELNIFW